MPADLNQLREQLRRQKPLAVTRDGQLVQSDRHYDGEMNNREYNNPRSAGTKLEPQRFAMS